MQNIAFITEKELPRLSEDDRLLISPLKKLGINIIPAFWNDPRVNWGDFKAVIFRSCWHYYLKIREFKIWLDKLETQNSNVWNPIEIIKWNIDKTYLINLKNQGINVIPTFTSINNLNTKSEDYILKPRFGTDSYDVRRIKRNDLNIIPKDFLVQPFIKEIVETGEISIIFIGNKISHAVRKKPKTGQFRTNYRSGSKWTSENLSTEHIKQARAILDSFKTYLLYARLDVIEVDGKLMVMEIELTEPFLYFSWHKQAIELFVQELVSKIS